MKTHKDLTGMTFNRLTVLREIGRNASRRDYDWLCRCTCGKEHVARGASLKEGSVKSCGCLNIESAVATGRKYGPLNAKPRNNLVGKKFGWLTVDSYAGNSHWLCTCDCGGKNTVRSDSLKKGQVRSCGCLRDAIKSRETIARNTTHGLTASSEYSNWKSMMSRCFNPKDSAYAVYGGVGKIACEFLKSTPANLILILGKKPTLKHEIDRINNALGYCCGNCAQCFEKGWPLNVRWATRKQNLRNKTTSALFTINGETKCASEWAEEMGLNWVQFAYRFRANRVH